MSDFKKNEHSLDRGISDLSRRQFLGLAAASLSAPFFIRAESASADEGRAPGSSKFFTERQRRTAAVLANKTVPRDQEPGAAELGAVDYIEQLLTAFESDPPRIYAADVSVDRFLPLDRFQEAAWRIRLYGSDEYARSTGRPYYGPKVKGLRELIPHGLDVVANLSPFPVNWMPKSLLSIVLGFTSKEFRQAFPELVVESCLSQTQYGGNRNGAGWKLSHFDGEISSYGWYNETSRAYEEDPDAPMSRLDTQPDEHPFGVRSHLMLDAVAIFTGGRIFHLEQAGEADFIRGVNEMASGDEEVES